MTTTEQSPTTTAADRAARALTSEVTQALAQDHGVCVRPVAMRRIDTTTGRVEVVPVPCRSTREDQCGPCAEKARRLRMAQCREGWHLDQEPILDRPEPTDEQKELMAARADLVAAYRECQHRRDDERCEQIADSVAELDAALREAGVRGRLTPLDAPVRPKRRSTRRRQDAPDLPRKPVERRTVGRVYAGKYRPSTFVTLTLPSYGRIDPDTGAPVHPPSYDYRSAARDAIHFPALLDRFWQNLRRCVGWDVQYFGAVEPQRRGAPHFHAALRGSVSRATLRQVAAATYHQVWWPPHDELVYSTDAPPQWDVKARAFTDPDTGQALPTFDQAADQLEEPSHVVRFGQQVHVKGILGGTEEADRHIGYLSKYLTKSVAQAAGLGEDGTDRQRDHAEQLHVELRRTPCSPRCAIWLLYGIQPRGARHSTTPGVCKANAHKAQHLGLAGRRVLVSRAWSGKTLAEHRKDRAAFVRQLLSAAGITPQLADDQDGPYLWERTAPGDTDVPSRPAMLLRLISERQRWRAEYTAAQQQASGSPPDGDRSAIDDQAV